MKYDPNNKADLAKLKEHEEFQFDIPSGVTFDQIASYIINLYDKESELRTLYFDYRDRKREAARRAGFKKDKTGKFEKEAENIILGSNTDVNHAIVFYLRQSGDPAFIMYATYWELLSREIEDSLSAAEAKQREYIRKNISDLSNKIEELEKSIFGGQEGEALRRSLYSDMEREKVRLRPEKIAADIKDKKLNLKDPYYE